MLEAKNIGLQIGRRTVLEDVSLSLEGGSVTAILGPNGAGKTSLLRVLSGEWSSQQGEVRLEGKTLASYSARQLSRMRAYLHQESNLDFAFTVEEVVMLGRSPHMEKGERPEDYLAAQTALSAVDMVDRSSDLYTRLSGGEKQRVQLARVLAQLDGAPAGHTAYLFLDEPTNNLDLSHQRTVFQVARQRAEAGTAVCMVLHDLNQALRHADQIIILQNGRIALQGDAEGVCDPEACGRIFGVPLQRVQFGTSRRPYLVEQDVSGPGNQPA